MSIVKQNSKSRIRTLTRDMPGGRKALALIITAGFVAILGTVAWIIIVNGKPVFVPHLDDGQLDVQVQLGSQTTTQGVHKTGAIEFELADKPPFVFAQGTNVILPCVRAKGQTHTADLHQEQVEPGHVALTCEDLTKSDAKTTRFKVTATCVVPASPPSPVAAQEPDSVTGEDQVELGSPSGDTHPLDCPDQHEVILYASYAYPQTPRLTRSGIRKFAASELDIVSLTYDDANESVTPRACKPGWETAPDHMCERVFRDLNSPDLTRTPRIDRVVMDRALFARIDVVPFMMGFMLALMALSLALAAISFVLIFIPPKKEFRWRTNIMIEILAWIETLGPAIGFALTVVGLASAFRSSADMAQGSGAFGGAVSVALASTLIGLLIRVFAHKARMFRQIHGHIYIDSFGNEIYPTSGSPYAPRTDEQDDPERPATETGKGD